jgi:hypothetical protein
VSNESITETLRSYRHSLWLALAGASCAAVLAACGSTGTSSRAASGDPAIKEAECMRSHGVTSFPDPSPGGPSVVPNSINTEAPAFQSAQKACARLLAGGSSQGSAAESSKLELLNLAKCMRAHGLPSSPDPTTSPPPAPPAGSHTGNAIGIGGVYLQLPRQSPAIKRAAAACGFKMP